MKHEWKVGDRAKCIDGAGRGLLNGQVYDVVRVEAGARLYLAGDRPRYCHAARRFKPVFRIQAPSRPTAETYAELRTAHGPSHYQTGREVFRGWGPARAIPKYEENGN